MASLGLEFLRFLDGQERMRQSPRYTPPQEAMEPQELPTNLAATSDADVDFDYSAVEWSAPSEDEVAILQKMLADNSVTLPGADFAEPPPEYDLPDARPDEGEMDNDREWV